MDGALCTCPIACMEVRTLGLESEFKVENNKCYWRDLATRRSLMAVDKVRSKTTKVTSLIIDIGYCLETTGQSG